MSIAVKIYVTLYLAKGSIGTETEAMRGLAIRSVVIGGYRKRVMVSYII